MKAKLITLAMSSLCIFNVISVAQAQGGYPATQGVQTSPGYPATQGYQASPGYPAAQGYQASPGYPAAQGYPAKPQEPPKKQKHHDKNKFSFSVNLPGAETIVVSNHGIRQQSREPQWIGMHTGDPLPRHAVISGGQPMPPATLYVCHANYRGGVHPGKLFNGKCNIGWGGEEISLANYEVLVSREALGWRHGSFGSIPRGAIQGGYQHDGPLFICQANFKGGTHSGKVVGQNCNFGWGGREISVPLYKVLVR